MQQNFNFGFSTHKSDILIHLSQWQYWWWFWFSLVWVVYYYVIITDSTKRTLTFNPVLNTSLRSHGKWGDFLVALIPLSWCGNILVNSNFILRIIEWQNESSLFTLRIQGKQWYWVYKYDGNAAVMIDSAPKNIGHDRWMVTTTSESYCVDSYYQALHLAAQLEFQDLYNIEIKKANISKKNLEASTLYTNQIYTPNTELVNNIKMINKNVNSAEVYNEVRAHEVDPDLWLQMELERSEEDSRQVREREELRNRYVPTDYFYYDEKYDAITKKLKDDIKSGLYQKRKFMIKKTKSLRLRIKLYNHVKKSKHIIAKYWPATPEDLKPAIIFSKQFLANKNGLYKNDYYFVDLYRDIYKINHYDLTKLDDTQNTFGNMRVLLANNPLLLHNGILNNHTIELLQSTQNIKTPLFFVISNNNNFIEPKINQTEDLWGFRQKRYKRLKEFKFTPREYYDVNTFAPVTQNTQSFIKVHSFIYNKQLQYNANVEDKPSSYIGNLSYKATADHPYTPINLEIQKTQTINTNNAYYFYSSLKLNKKRTEILSVNLARRLLRTKRTLVLPTHVNITVITNSYDVVHSWFIPGLGLKLDCVPGRSTHHTLYVDNVGFYYGQCAEICGRYHHHMPIRVCAIPFEQFLVWWHTKGLPRTLRLHQNRILLNKQHNKQIIHKALIQYRYNF